MVTNWHINELIIRKAWGERQKASIGSNVYFFLKCADGQGDQWYLCGISEGRNNEISKRPWWRGISERHGHAKITCIKICPEFGASKYRAEIVLDIINPISPDLARNNVALSISVSSRNGNEIIGKQVKYFWEALKFYSRNQATWGATEAGRHEAANEVGPLNEAG